MKKRILIVVGLFCLMLMIGGIYIITTIETATSELDHLIKLHQVEILREHLLIQIKNVQSNLYLMGTRYESSPQQIATDMNNLKKISITCFDCHHSVDVNNRLKSLGSDVELLQNSIARLLKIKNNPARLVQEGDTAFQTGQTLVMQVKDMVHIAQNKLAEKTRASLTNISRSKFILYAMVALTPFIAAGLFSLLIREFTQPVQVLLAATRKLKSGDLNYRVEGLKDEFGEVATSFNEMLESLKENLLQIQESEQRYRTLFESAGDAIFIIDIEGERTGEIVDANPAAAKMHGYRIEELLKLNLIKDLDAPEAAAAAPQSIERILNGEWIKDEINHQKKDGTLFPVEISAGLIQFMGRKFILAIDRDISERKQMERMLIQAKIEWEDTFNAITDMITIHDTEFNILRANKAAEKILGLPLLKNQKAKCYQYYHGTDQPPETCASCKCLETEEPVTCEMYEPHLFKFLEIRAMPMYDNRNRLSGLIHVIRDITQRKSVEEALQRAEQLKMVGELAAGLAHEIKNPLAGIKGSIQVLVETTAIAEEDRALILKAIDEIKRIETLLKSLLNFAKPPKLTLMPTDVNDLLDKAIALSLQHPSLAPGGSKSVDVLKDFDPDLGEIMADPMQLQQVFLNLMFNAIEAMPQDGALAVKTLLDDSDNMLRIAISDSGKGMEPSVLDQIFQPFFTTKRKGSGLGLSICQRLIDQHSGTISAESAPGKGTVFTLQIPIRKAAEKQKDTSA
ncbi:MAG: PAS domain S-box protein [Desulfobacterales bacterium]|jgi:PAS domain S-box-containing protein